MTRTPLLDRIAARHSGVTPTPGSLAIVRPEVRESAVGSQRYPDPLTVGVTPEWLRRAREHGLPAKELAA